MQQAHLSQTLYLPLFEGCNALRRMTTSDQPAHRRDSVKGVKKEGKRLHVLFTNHKYT